MRALKRVIAITLLSTLPMVTSHAALGWFVCEVEMTGMVDSNFSFVNLTDLGSTPAFSRKWFRSNSTIPNQVLATTLAALTNDMRVFVYLDPDAPGFPEVIRVYLMK